MATGCYVPQYKTASFKGISAICVEASYEGGRRGAEGEFPFGESTAYADLGRRIRRFPLKFVFRENSHLADAKRFFRACESPGPGTLVHPAYGSVRAACKSIKIHDNLETGQGESSADVEFVEATQWISGFGLGASIFGLSVSSLVSAVSTYVQQGLTAALGPFFANAIIGSIASQAVTTVTEQLLIASGLRDDDRTYWSTVSELRAIATEIATAMSAERTWIGIAGGFVAIETYATSPLARLTAHRAIANAVATAPLAQPAAQAAQEVLAVGLRVLAGAYSARAANEVEINSLPEALALYDRITTLLETERNFARDACLVELVLQIDDFLSQARIAMLNRAYNAPPIVEYDFDQSVWSLQAAYEIYGDAKRFGEIEAMNRRQPAFSIGPLVVARRSANADETLVGS